MESLFLLGYFRKIQTSGICLYSETGLWASGTAGSLDLRYSFVVHLLILYLCTTSST